MLRCHRESIQTVLVHKRDTSRETLRKHRADFKMAILRREHERRVMVGVAGDFVVVVAGEDEEICDLGEAQRGGEVEGGVGLVFEVRVCESSWAVVDNTTDEERVVEEDSASKTRGDVDPGGTVRDVL